MQTNLKIGYAQTKRIKKLYGKMVGREIAFGRKLIESMKRNYHQIPLIIIKGAE
jgi:hypothetical protein